MLSVCYYCTIIWKFFTWKLLYWFLEIPLIQNVGVCMYVCMYMCVVCVCECVHVCVCVCVYVCVCMYFCVCVCVCAHISSITFVWQICIVGIISRCDLVFEHITETNLLRLTLELCKLFLLIFKHLSYSGKVLWGESLTNLANRQWFTKLKPSRLLLTINNLLADLLIYQTSLPLNFPAIQYTGKTCKTCNNMECFSCKSGCGIYALRCLKEYLVCAIDKIVYIYFCIRNIIYYLKQLYH